MKARDLLTSAEVLEALGWKHAKRLRRWVQMGVLPEPVVDVHRSGRGRTSYWPNWIVPYCERILRLRSLGLSLKEAAGQAGEPMVSQIWVAGRVEEPPGAPHIVAVVPYFVPHIGGGESHLYQLARGLERRGHSLAVLTQRLPGTEAREGNGRIEVFRYGNAAAKKNRRRGYERILDEVRRIPLGGAVLYLYLSVGSEYRTDVMLQILRVCHQRRIPTVVRIPSSGRVTELVSASPDSVLEVKRATRIIALNPGIRRELLGIGVEPERILGIPNGVDTELFCPADAEGRRSIRAAFETGERSRVLVCPSRFAPKKRLPELVKLWSELESSCARPCRLWLIGEPRSAAKRGKVSRAVAGALAAKKVTSVHLFPGMPHREIAKFYQGGDAYVSLSVQEGMSNALLEAMASSLPVVAPATDAVVQLIREGENGYLFEPGDDKSALAAMRRTVEAPRSILHAMGARNRDRVRELYTLEKMADAFSSLFSKLAGDGVAAEVGDRRGAGARKGRDVLGR